MVNFLSSRASVLCTSTTVGRRRVKNNAIRKEPPRVSSLKRARGAVNSANSANCVIPKRVVDRLDAAPGYGWCERRSNKKKRSRVARYEGCGRSNSQGGGKERRLMRLHACITHSHHLRRVQRNTGNLFPRELAVVSRRGDYKAPRFLLAPIPGSTLCNTQHLHTILISYLSTARSARASLHAHTSVRFVYRVSR